MDVFPSPQPCAVGEVDKNHSENQYGLSYAAAVTSGNHSAEEISKLELYPVSVENGIPTVEFTIEDVNSFTREEGLHQAVVIKFSHGKPALQELRQILPKQFEVKGCYSIGQLEYCHILVRFVLFEDFAKVVSRSSGYVQSKGDVFFFRTFPWTMGFNPREETSKAVVWISFPQLPANLFARKSLMSIASAVGKPISVDKATKDRTRPSTARVKVLINILDIHPNKIKIKILDTKSGKMIENDQQIVIDNLPKYCTLCNHRDHDVKSCRWNTEVFNGKVPLYNETEGNFSLIESGRDARELLNDIKASRISEMNSLDVSDSAQIGNSYIRSKKIVPGELINVEHVKTKRTVESDSTMKAVSLKSSNKASFKNSIANSIFEAGSISGFNFLNAQQKYTAKHWRAVQPTGTNANDVAISDLSVSKQKPVVQLNNHPLSGFTAVTDKLKLGSLKAAENSIVSVVSQASKSARAIKEVDVNLSMNVVNRESVALAKDHASGSIHHGHFAGQSKLKDNDPMNTSNHGVIFNADTQATDKERASKEAADQDKEVLDSVSSRGLEFTQLLGSDHNGNLDLLNNISDIPLPIDNRGQSFVLEGQHDNPLISTVALVASTADQERKILANEDPVNQSEGLASRVVSNSANATDIKTVYIADETGSHLSQSDIADVQQTVEDEDPSEQNSHSANAAAPQTVIGKESSDQTEGDQFGREAGRFQFSQDTQTFKDAGEINEKEIWSSISNKNRKPVIKSRQQSELICSDVPTDHNSFAALVNSNDENETQPVTIDKRAKSQFDNLVAVDRNKVLTTSSNAVIEDALKQQKEDEERYRLKGKAVAPYIPSSQKKVNYFLRHIANSEPRQNERNWGREGVNIRTLPMRKAKQEQVGQKSMNKK